MEKRDTSLPAATIAADLGLFIHLGGWRPAELERLKKGAGRWMRRIDAAMENWCEDLGVSDARIVAVVLLYRCPGQDRIPFDGPEEAIHIANDTIYGLAAGIWTRNIDKAFRLIKNIEAGVVWVNSYEDGDMTQPFGGYKQSGQARDKCMESLKSYTQSKSAWIRLAAG